MKVRINLKEEWLGTFTGELVCIENSGHRTVGGGLLGYYDVTILDRALGGVEVYIANVPESAIEFLGQEEEATEGGNQDHGDFVRRRMKAWKGIFPAQQKEGATDHESNNQHKREGI